MSPSGFVRVCDDDYVGQLADAVAGKLGGKVGVAPANLPQEARRGCTRPGRSVRRLRPAPHYSLTLGDSELTPVERQATGATNVDEVDLEL